MTTGRDRRVICSVGHYITPILSIIASLAISDFKVPWLILLFQNFKDFIVLQYCLRAVFILRKQLFFLQCSSWGQLVAPCYGVTNNFFLDEIVPSLKTSCKITSNKVFIFKFAETKLCKEAFADSFIAGFSYS